MRRTKQERLEDLATVLAALRLWQRTYEGKDAEVIRAEWSHFQEVAPLGTDDIDRLCERLNLGERL